MSPIGLPIENADLTEIGTDSIPTRESKRSLRSRFSPKMVLEKPIYPKSILLLFLSVSIKFVQSLKLSDVRDLALMRTHRSPHESSCGFARELVHSLSKKRKVRWGAKHSPAAWMPESVTARRTKMQHHYASWGTPKHDGNRQ